MNKQKKIVLSLILAFFMLAPVLVQLYQGWLLTSDTNTVTGKVVGLHEIREESGLYSTYIKLEKVDGYFIARNKEYQSINVRDLVRITYSVSSREIIRLQVWRN